ncbi:MAG TPA: DUF3618 domain-containing protein [Solirubrobacteraceae bacterium]|nr:DUF3618 domain-containing protein [Solirubrobacteraceae bacterium]
MSADRTPAAPAGSGGSSAVGGPAERRQRTPEEIRASIESNRRELGAAVARLRREAAELADWRGHIRRHQREVLIGAAAAGFIIGGGVAGIVGLFRRRRR